MSKQWFGWAGCILRVNLTTGEISKEPLDPELARAYLGQSGINAKLLYDLVTPGLDPLSADNPLIFGVGPLGGSLAPCSGRFTVTSKSPLTGIFGDSNCGGHWGPELKNAGYDHIVITGRAEHPVYLWINDDRVELRDARKLWGKTTWETDELIRTQLSQPTAQVACIGPAGENMVRFAAIICNLARAAARTGLGAVMGSKNLKAVVVKGDKGMGVANSERFSEVVHQSVADIQEDPLYGVATTFGTTAITGLAQMLGFLPTRNFQASTFEEAENLRGEVLLEKHVTKHKGCFNCPVSCSRFYKVAEGEYKGTVGEGPEYESVSALGSKCGNGNLPSILHANTLCNQLGLDTISCGNVISWAMEAYQRKIINPLDFAGVELDWGNHRTINELIVQIAHRQGLGDILAEGTLRAARKLGGEEFAVHSKGMDYPAVDVRGTKGMALAFSVSPRGADHLKGLPLYEVAPEIYQNDIKTEIDIDITPAYWSEYNTKAKLISWHENWHCVVDSLGLCKLEGIAIKPLKPKHFQQLLSAATGWDISIEELEAIGERIWNLERLFGVREGIRRDDDLPPARLYNEPVATGPAAGERLDHDKYEAMLNEYYDLRGWDKTTGIPLRERMQRLGLEKELAQALAVPVVKG